MGEFTYRAYERRAEKPEPEPEPGLLARLRGGLRHLYGAEPAAPGVSPSAEADCPAPAATPLAAPVAWAARAAGARRARS